MANETTVLNVTENSKLKERSCKWEYLPDSEDEAVRLLKKTPALYSTYQGLDDGWRQRFLDFCVGKKSLPLTYDPFFKRMFHPDVHPDRLSGFVSSILGMKVKVLHILPSEDSVLDGGNPLIMDLLGELEDGSLINVEIQKQGYAFPAERISCYSSDLVMRQYVRVKGERGSGFTYRDIKKVYVIVIFEKSTKEFHKIKDAYVHHGRTTFKTGLQMEFLQEYYLIALDVFRKIPYPKGRGEQSAWLSLLITESVEEAESLIEEYPEYPWIEEIYREIAGLRQNPKEVLGMFSEALRILDENTMKYMIEELEKELEEKSAAIEERDTAIREKDTAIREKESAIKEKDMALEEKEAEISELKKLLNQYRNIESRTDL